MKESLINNYTLIRFIRFAIGIAVIVQAYVSKDLFFGIAGLLLAGMAVLNMGCCGAAGCSAPVKKNAEADKEISFDEVL